ncbi:hypothetical protein CgunFtcFv8_025372 [Champsocephalus gunnari]|uniref:Uncharacterized protein n=1 Tax=Champsocephalus gunnari TaxID=52237 RepID=A0AAN8H394_CHAGU|nr:hypothetical protein CgunFtcFv8_025372 [Champsocephalus gunnari]
MFPGKTVSSKGFGFAGNSWKRRSFENPELIWNDDSREKVSTTVREMTLDHFKHQKDDPDVNWKLPEDFPVACGAGQGELQVGGVFQRIFIDYRLRKFHLPPFVFR